MNFTYTYTKFGLATCLFLMISVFFGQSPTVENCCEVKTDFLIVDKKIQTHFIEDTKYAIGANRMDSLVYINLPPGTLMKTEDFEKEFVNKNQTQK